MVSRGDRTKDMEESQFDDMVNEDRERNQQLVYKVYYEDGRNQND